MRRFDLLILDFDGVLVESVDVKSRAFAALYAGYGASVVQKVVAYHLAHGGRSRFEKFRHFHRTFLGKSLRPDEEAELGVQFSVLVEDAVVQAPWVAGAHAFLEHNHRRLPIFVASGTPEDELIRIVERREATRYFTGVHGSPRSKAEIIRACVGNDGLALDRVLMVGDTITDYEGARDAGVSFLGITTDRAVFPAATPILPNLTGLEDVIGTAETR